MASWGVRPPLGFCSHLPLAAPSRLPRQPLPLGECSDPAAPRSPPALLISQHLRLPSTQASRSSHSAGHDGTRHFVLRHELSFLSGACAPRLPSPDNLLVSETSLTSPRPWPVSWGPHSPPPLSRLGWGSCEHSCFALWWRGLPGRAGPGLLLPAVCAQRSRRPRTQEALVDGQ